MLLISGKMAFTQQSTGIGDRFLEVEDGDRPMWQPTTSDLVVIFIIYTTKSAATDGDGCGESEGANNNIQNEHISWI